MDTRLNTNRWPYDPNFQDFATFLGLKAERDGKGIIWPYSDKTAIKLEDLYKWGKIKSESFKHEDIKRVVYDLTKKAGVNWIGETLIDKLWQHIQFDSDIKNADYKQLEQKEQKIKEKQNQTGKEIKLDKSDEKKPKELMPATVKPIKMKHITYRVRPQNEIHIVNKRSKPLISEAI